MTDKQASDLLPTALDLPTVTSITPGMPPVLVLDDSRIIKLADLPHICLLPRTAQGVAVLLTNWRDPEAPVLLVPQSLVSALLELADQWGKVEA